jgi:hypothetical protein
MVMCANVGRRDGLLFRPIEEPKRICSSSRRVISRYQKACALIRTANSILVTLISLHTGKLKLNEWTIPDAVNLFLSYCIRVGSVEYEKRVHAFAVDCARRLLTRRGGVLPRSVASDVNYYPEHLLTQLDLTSANYLNERLNVPLISDRVSLPDSLSAISMIDHLPPEFSEFYSSPENCLLSEPPAKLPRPYFGAEPKEYIKVVRRLSDLDMVTFRPAVKVVNGMFAVAKGENSQRLILDCRPANSLFKPVIKTLLPSPADLSNLLLPENKVVYGAKCDLDNYYHRVVVPDWMVDYFGLPKIRAGDISEELATQHGADTMLFPAFLRLPMGFVAAVHISSSLHAHFLRSTVLGGFRFLLPGQAFVLRIGEVLIILYIDDLVLLSTDRDLLNRLLQTLLVQYRSAGFVVKDSKLILPTTQLPILGLEFDGENHTLAVSSDRLAQIRGTCFALVGSGLASTRQLQLLLGHIVWSSLVRRPLLSVLCHIYHFMSASDDVVALRPLWGSVKHELLSVAYLTPLMFARLSPHVFKELLCTDASPIGGALVSAPMPKSFWSTLHLISGRPKPFHTKDLTDGVFASNLRSCRWRLCFQTPWRYTDAHINSLEMVTIQMAVDWLVSHPITNFRATVFTDSMVCASVLAKGRTSSPKIIRPLRRISALLLSVGGSLLTPYVNTKLNPADKPSRDFDSEINQCVEPPLLDLLGVF